MPWLNASSAGRVAYEDFQQRLWRPVVAASASADASKVLSVVAPYFFDGAKFDTLSSKVREQVTSNLREWQALGRSSDAFANIRRVDVAAIVAPTLLMEGHNTLALHRILNAQYAALLPNRRLVVIEHATHQMWDEQPVRCREETLQFLAQ